MLPQAGDLSGVVHGDTVGDDRFRQHSEIQDIAVLIPYHGALMAGRKLRPARDDAAFADPVGDAPRASQRSEIDEVVLLGRNGMCRRRKKANGPQKTRRFAIRVRNHARSP